MKVEDIVVELVPHKGLTDGPVPVEVELPQSVILVNGVWAGYVGHDPNAPVQIILSNLPSVVVAEVKKQVDEKRKVVSPAVLQAKSLTENIPAKEEAAKPANPLNELGL